MKQLLKRTVSVALVLCLLMALAPLSVLAGDTFGPYDYCVNKSLIIFLWNLAGAPAAQGDEAPFANIPNNAGYYDAVCWAKANDVGIVDNAFLPQARVTRGYMAYTLWSAAGKPMPQSMDNPFVDVTESDYYYTAVLWTVENGISGGVGVAKYGPNEYCNRGQIATFLWSAQGRPDPTSLTQPYTDVEISDYFFKPVCWGEEHDIFHEPADSVPHTHSYTSAVTQPTCAAQGFTTYTCTCGHSYTADYVPANGLHNFVGFSCLICGAANPDAYKCGDNVHWSYNESSKTLTISGTGPMYDYEYLATPWLDPGCPEPNYEVKKIVVEQGVTHLGAYAFCHLNAEEVHIPASVSSIGAGSVNNLLSLKAFHVAPRSTVYKSDLYGALLTADGTKLLKFPTAKTGDYRIPEGVTAIGNAAFNGTALSKLTLSESLQSIGDRAFLDSRSLREIHLPKNVTSIGENAFAECQTLEKITVDEANPAFVTDQKGVLYTKDMTQLVRAVGDIGLHYVIPYGVEEICPGALLHNQAVEYLYVPVTLQKIGEEAISGTNISFIEFAGSREQWNAIVIDGIEQTYSRTIFYDYQCPHSETPAAGWAPTCTEAGMTDGTYCSRCKMPLQPQETLPPTGHSYADGFCTVCGVKMESPFGDVKEEDFYYEPVLWALARNVTSGVSATSFGPMNPCTRGQVVTFLWRAAGQPVAVNRTNPFADVSEGQFYYEAVLWAVEKGITSGVSANAFAPDATCTRGQIVTFLHRAMGEPAYTVENNPFTDVSPAEFCYDAVLWAVENGITSGTSATTFAPNDTCTRGQVVTFLYRTYK